MATKVSKETTAPGTPTSLLLSIVCTIVVFALAEIQNSFTLSDSSSMRFVLMGYVGLGLTLAFFWKRLEKSVFLKLACALYMFGLWVSLFVTTLAPVLLEGDNPLIQRTLFQQFGLGFIALSGVSLMIGLLQKQKMVPGLVLSSLGALGLVLTSGGSFFMKAQQTDGDSNLISSLSLAAKKDKSDDHGKEDSDETEIVSQHAPAHDETPAHGYEHAALADHTEAPAHGKSLGHNKTPIPAAAPAHGDDHKVKLSAKSLPHDDSEEEEDAHEQGGHHEPAPQEKHASSDDREEPAHGAPALKATPKTKGKVSPPARSTVQRWAYEQGEKGPGNWGELADEFRTCSVGQQQSPIDIPTSWPLLSDVTLDYKLTSISVVDTGRSIEFNFGKQNTATIAGRRYTLVSMDLHTPSEHWIDGRISPLELHFVHKDDKNHVAVIAVMVEPGKEQKTFADMWGYIPQGINLPASPRNKVFNIASLIPTKPKVYRYNGSLTTPPCSEHVVWSIASEKITMSPSQIEAIKARYNNNVRPLQKREARLR